MSTAINVATAALQVTALVLLTLSWVWLMRGTRSDLQKMRKGHEEQLHRLEELDRKWKEAHRARIDRLVSKTRTARVVRRIEFR